ncbi:unnamed protein product [Camellia sinensis]
MGMVKTLPILMVRRRTIAIHTILPRTQLGLFRWVLQKTSFDLIKEWVVNNPKASIFTAEGANEFKGIAIYQDYHGLPEFRKGVAKFMGKVRGDRVTFDLDRIVMSGGATGAHEMLAFCLADPGEAFLVPTPYYAGSDYG